MNTFFQSHTFLKNSNKEILKCHINQNTTHLENVQITEHEITAALKTLKLGKATGPDNINNRVLKELLEQLANPLSKLFNKSISSGKLPSQWKFAHVCAIHKKVTQNLPQTTDPFHS